MRFQFRSPEARRCRLTQVYHIANFKVKNDSSHVYLIITHGINPLPPVEVPPGGTSPPFTNAGTYKIHPGFQAPPPDSSSEIVVTFSPKKEIEAKSIGKPIDAEIIAKFD